MRDIKFRAWNGAKMKFDIAPIDKESYIVFETKRKNAQDLHISRGKIMEYTGLKDKNGVEVYEGDILTVLELTGNRELEYISKVEWRDSMFLVTEPNGSQTPVGNFDGLEYQYIPLTEVEVIGNVYENPEILK